jgi:hypothetical protein
VFVPEILRVWEDKKLGIERLEIHSTSNSPPPSLRNGLKKVARAF